MIKQLIYTAGIILFALSCSKGEGDGPEIPAGEPFSIEIVPSDGAPVLWQQVGFYLKHNAAGIKEAVWDFGDGASVAGTAVEHGYRVEGTFSVSVKAIASDGSTTEHSLQLAVAGRSMSKALKFFDRSRIWLCAHRCNTGDASVPENSIAALKECIELGYIDIVEIDPRITLDGVMVLMHDETVTRTTNGTGKISDLTWSQVRALRLKLPDGTVTADTVPTLREFLTEAKDRVFVDLDFINKVPHPQLYELVKECGMLDQVMFYTSSDSQAIASLLGYSPPGIVFTQTGSESNASAYKQQGIYVTQITAAKMLETNLGAIAAQNSLAVLSNTLVQNGITIDNDVKYNNDYSGVDKLLEGGINIIQTDQAPLMDAYLKSKNKR